MKYRHPGTVIDGKLLANRLSKQACKPLVIRRRPESSGFIQYALKDFVSALRRIYLTGWNYMLWQVVHNELPVFLKRR